MRKEIICCAIWLAAALCGFAIGPEVKRADLALEIVPTPQQPQDENPTLFAGDVFYVVLTNISDKSIPIFEDWSSRGWFSLSFEGVAEDGKTYKLVKNPDVTFSRNAPGKFVIPPKGHYVFKVDFRSKNWPILDSLPRHLRLKAVFEQSNEAGKGVWSGRIESEPRSFGIFR